MIESGGQLLKIYSSSYSFKITKAMRFFNFLFTLLLFCTQLSAQEYTIDPGHTSIQFSVERFGTVQVNGRFNDFSGTVQYDSTLQKIQSADISIDVKSIDTGHKVRDGHLKSEIWLDAEKYPEIQFQTTEVIQSDTGMIAVGSLTIHGTTKPIQIPFERIGPLVDPTKTKAIGISGAITINRQDYGIQFSKVFNDGILFIGNDVHININALAIQRRQK